LSNVTPGCGGSFPRLLSVSVCLASLSSVTPGYGGGDGGGFPHLLSVSVSPASLSSVTPGCGGNLAEW